jgi:RNA polymerase sigma-70 factor (ECF subfamily)
MRLSAEGDQDAFAELYRQVSPHLYGLVLRILRRKDWAEEVLQEGFLNIWNHAGEYQPRKGSPFAWMAAILRNRALDMLRRHRREIFSSDESFQESLPGEDPSPLDQLVSGSESKALKHCLEELEGEQRQSILWAYWRGMTHQELSRQLKKPLGTVKSWVRRGLEKLKRCLES